MGDDLLLDETHFDVIIIGTSIVQSLLAGALSRSGKKVLHLDRNDYYAGIYSSFSFDDFLTFISNDADGEKNTPRKELSDQSRSYNVDVLPKLLYASGPMTTAIVRSSVTHYVDFKCIAQELAYISSEFREIPSSRNHIFNNNFLSLIEKRKLMKFISTYILAPNSPLLLPENRERSFAEFLDSQNLGDKINKFILYSISLLTFDQANHRQATQEEAFHRIQFYSQSVGRYGSTPFIYPLYGTSELPQAFSRLCAVNSGVYVLRRSAKEWLLTPQHQHQPSQEEIEPKENQEERDIDKQGKKLYGIVCTAGQQLTCDYLISTIDDVPSPYITTTLNGIISRCVCITDAPLVKNETSSGENSLFVVIPPKEEKFNNQHPILILQLDSPLRISPQNKYLVHLTTHVTKQGSEDESALRIRGQEQLSYVISHFFNVLQQEQQQTLNNEQDQQEEKEKQKEVREEQATNKSVEFRSESSDENVQQEQQKEQGNTSEELPSESTEVKDQALHTENEPKTSKPNVLWHGFFHLPKRQFKIKNGENEIENVFVVGDGEFDVDYSSELDEATRIFQKICPSAELFQPRQEEADDEELSM